jgi:hypothetical protein
VGGRKLKKKVEIALELDAIFTGPLGREVAQHIVPAAIKQLRLRGNSTSLFVVATAIERMTSIWDEPRSCSVKFATLTELANAVSDAIGTRQSDPRDDQEPARAETTEETHVATCLKTFAKNARKTASDELVLAETKVRLSGALRHVTFGFSGRQTPVTFTLTIETIPLRPVPAGQFPLPTSWRISERPPQLIGRSAHLATAERAIQKGRRRILFRGTPGSGRSALLLQCAWQWTPVYPDVQFRLNARGATTEALLRQALSYADVQLPDSANLDQLAIQLREWTQQRSGILLIDDPSSHEQIQPLLPSFDDWLVLASGTSRMQGFHEVGVEPLSHVDAREVAERMDANTKVDLGPEARRILLSRASFTTPELVQVSHIGSSKQDRTKRTYGRIRPLTVSDAIADISGGLPGMVRSVVEELQQEEVFGLDSHLVNILKEPRAELRESAGYRSWRNQYDQLDADCAHVLRMLSAIGFGFDSEVAKEVTGEPELICLRQLVRLRMVQCNALADRFIIPEPKWQFARDLLTGDEKRTAFEKSSTAYINRWVAVLGTRTAHTFERVEGGNLQRAFEWALGHRLNNSCAKALIALVYPHTRHFPLVFTPDIRAEIAEIALDWARNHFAPGQLVPVLLAECERLCWHQPKASRKVFDEALGYIEVVPKELFDTPVLSLMSDLLSDVERLNLRLRLGGLTWSDLR